MLCPEWSAPKLPLPEKSAMVSKTMLLVALLALSSVPAQAEELLNYGGVKVDAALSPAYSSCFGSAGGNDLGMAECVAAETKVWDRRLNAAYATLRAKLPKNDFAALQSFQRLWIADRDAACRDSGENGTSGRVEAAGCVLRSVVLRAVELELRTGAGG
jgi:uncharacterized protein YecT (DUF1311 family)